MGSFSQAKLSCFVSTSSYCIQAEGEALESLIYIATLVGSKLVLCRAILMQGQSYHWGS